MDTLITSDLPKRIALNTCAHVKEYLATLCELIDWTPDSFLLGAEIIGALESIKDSDYEVSYLAFRSMESVHHYGNTIAHAVMGATHALAIAVQKQVQELDLYWQGQMIYKFRGWCNYQLILECMDDAIIQDGHVNLAFTELDYNLQDADVCALPDFFSVQEALSVMHQHLTYEAINEYEVQYLDDGKPNHSARPTYRANWGCSKVLSQSSQNQRL